MRVRDLRTGTDLPDLIPETTYGSAWAGDTTFFYVRQDQAMRPHQVWRHEIGTSADDDVLVYEDDDERFFVSVGLSLTEEWIQIGSGSRSEEHTSELQSLMRISYAVFCLKKKKQINHKTTI